MRIIGLTGGIGSGKSFVAQVAEKYFSVLHISSDEIARRQMQKGGISYKRVVEEFSGMTDDLLCEDGEINRTALSKLVMNDPVLLKKLDAITHPAVIDEINTIIAIEDERKIFSAVMVETALLYEAGIDRMCDEVWYVYAPLATRSSRLIKMRGYSTEKTEMFLKNQQPEEEFLRRSDRTVPNGEDVTESDMIKIISAYLNC
ncbi:MAG: dephospho-CoA kinase [Lachnospiraceae bacterium]|nr:dephospho-CoA kinase [Lachnospiraceae bacterium]